MAKTKRNKKTSPVKKSQALPFSVMTDTGFANTAGTNVNQVSGAQRFVGTLLMGSQIERVLPQPTFANNNNNEQLQKVNKEFNALKKAAGATNEDIEGVRSNTPKLTSSKGKSKGKPRPNSTGRDKKYFETQQALNAQESKRKLDAAKQQKYRDKTARMNAETASKNAGMRQETLDITKQKIELDTKIQNIKFGKIGIVAKGLQFGAAAFGQIRRGH